MHPHSPVSSFDKPPSQKVRSVYPLGFQTPDSEAGESCALHSSISLTFVHSSNTLSEPSHTCISKDHGEYDSICPSGTETSTKKWQHTAVTVARKTVKGCSVGSEEGRSTCGRRFGAEGGRQVERWASSAMCRVRACEPRATPHTCFIPCVTHRSPRGGRCCCPAFWCGQQSSHPEVLGVRLALHR